MITAIFKQRRSIDGWGIKFQQLDCRKYAFNEKGQGFHMEVIQLKSMQNNITVTADFGGGLDLVFDGKTEVKLELALPATVSSVIRELADRHANHKKDMFAINGIIRPGILVLINDADWELSEKEETVLENRDKVSFISTLHGG